MRRKKRKATQTTGGGEQKKTKGKRIKSKEEELLPACNGFEKMEEGELLISH
jgi:hypothetical protein